MVSTIRVSTHLPPIRAHCGGIVRGRRGRERRAGRCGLGETQNALLEATATDTRRTRTDISTRCSVMRSVCSTIGTRHNTRRRMGCLRALPCLHHGVKGELLALLHLHRPRVHLRPLQLQRLREVGPQRPAAESLQHELGRRAPLEAHKGGALIGHKP